MVNGENPTKGSGSTTLKVRDSSTGREPFPALLRSISDLFNGHDSLARDREKARIFQHIALVPESTRKRISERLGLRPTGVSKSVQEMMTDGLVTEGRPANEGSRGRPEPVLEFLPNRVVAVAIHTSGHQLIGLLYNLREDVVANAERQLRVDATNIDFLNALNHIVAELIDSRPPHSRVAGIGISLLGLILPGRAIWRRCSHWPCIRELDLTPIENTFGIPLTLRHSLDAELEYILVNDRRHENQNVALVHWGYGVGASFSVNGKILESSSGRFGELGHVRVINDNARKCPCGSTGCLETVSAMWAVVPEISQRLGTENMHLHDNEYAFTQFLSSIDVENVPEIQSALDHFSTALINFYRIVQPEMIYLIGPFTDQKSIFHSLADRFRHSTIGFSDELIEVAAVRGGFKGCVNASTYKYFRSELRKLLQMKR